MCLSGISDILPVDIAFLCGMIVLLVLAAVSARKMHNITLHNSFLESSELSCCCAGTVMCCEKMTMTG